MTEILLKIVNAVPGLCILAILAVPAMPILGGKTSVLEETHEIAGIVFLVLPSIHIVINHRWIINQLRKNDLISIFGNPWPFLYFIHD